MIQLSQVSKTFHTESGIVTALQQINLQVKTGQIFGVVGASGAGKSTLIRCVNLLERPTAGKVVVDGQDLLTLSNQQLARARREIGMIFQHFNLLHSAQVYHNIALPLVLAGASRKQIAATVEPLLELTQLADKRNSYPHELSGGQKQRVAIARALASKPKVLLSDEATSALDPANTKAILKLLSDINQQLGLTILLITHEMEVVKQICDQVALIEGGRIIEQASVTDFFLRPQTALAAALAETSFNHELPDFIQRKLRLEPAPEAKPLLRLIFQGERVQEPLISDVVSQFGLGLNILQANIELVRHQTFGIMYLEVYHQTPRLQAAMDYLKTKGLLVELLGYVSHPLQ